MTIESLSRAATLAAVLNGIASIASTMSIILMFVFGGPWGRVNDATSVVWMASFVPIALLFYAVLRDRHTIAAAIGLAVGLICIVLFSLVQLALTLGIVSFEDTCQAVTFLGAGVGLWLVISGVLFQVDGLVSGRIILLTLMLGTGYLLGGIGFVLSGWQHPLALGGFASTALLCPLWAFALARYISSDPIAVHATG